jgi:hypothetical protein
MPIQEVQEGLARQTTGQKLVMGGTEEMSVDQLLE